MPESVLFCVVGTRPEAIKMAPVVQELRRFSTLARTLLISTGQHREILHESLAAFGLQVDVDLDIMTHGQTLAEVTSKALLGLDRRMLEHGPAMVLAQGDTTTTFAAALAAFYRQIPFGHVEAGLRTNDIGNPFPEEFNRRVAGLTASLHFPPTEWAKENLLKEGTNPDTVFVTGNTGIDAVLEAAKFGAEWYPSSSERILLLTTHRRENWGEPQERIARSVRELVDEFSDTRLVVALHPNPNVRQTLGGILGDHPRIDMIEPPEYLKFVKLMQRSTLIFTDSGGVQEEAPSFGIPVLVLRDTTERPEGVTAGTARLVGTDPKKIQEQGRLLLSNKNAYTQMAQATSPYGDGHASQRIRYHVLKSIGIQTERPA